MKVKTKFLQQGGQMEQAPVEATPAQSGQGGQGGQEGNPEEQLAQMAMQIVQQLGPEASAALAEMIMQILQQAASQAQQEPVYAKKGGKLTMIGRR